MYKDKDKQREAQREWVRQKRATKGSTEKGSTSIHSNLRSDLNPVPKRGKDIKCFADLPPDVQATIKEMSRTVEEEQKRTAAAIKYQHLFPDKYESQSLLTDAECEALVGVTGKPGDSDYDGICTPEWRAEHGR